MHGIHGWICRLVSRLLPGVVACTGFAGYGADASAQLAPMAANANVPLVALPRLVFCHYTAWHNPVNTSFSIGKFYNYPQLRSSGSQHNDYKEEIRLAQESGIDGFFIDVVGGNKKPTAFFANVGGLLRAAEGGSFLVGPCLDVAYDDLDWQVSELDGFFKQYAAHPNYPKVAGRPVIITYSCLGRTIEQWHYIRVKLAEKGWNIFLIANLGTGFNALSKEKIDEYASEFDMIHTFGESGINRRSIRENFDLLASRAHAAGKGWVPSIHPGYIGAWMNGRNDYYQPHRGLDQMLDCWSAIAPGQAEWLQFTTWNDHDETPLMPMSFDFGGASRINRAYADRFKGKPYLQEKAQIVFAYHREEIAGTVWRLEGVSLPGTEGDYVEVSGALKGPDGQTLVELTARTLSLQDFDRTEWNIPTLALASVAGVTPQMRCVIWKNHAPMREEVVNLPELFLKSGWIQNQVTVRAPLSRFSNERAVLNVEQNGNVLKATLGAKLSEPVTHASLWRNDRPVGEFVAATGLQDGEGYVHLWVSPRGANNAVRLKVEGGRIDFAARSFNDDGKGLQYDATTLNSGKLMGWEQLALRLAARPDAKILLTVNKDPEITIPLQGLLNQQAFSFPEENPSVRIELADCDTGFLRHPALPETEGRARQWKLQLLSRVAYENDIFTARLETASGKVVFADLVTPFTDGKLIPLNLMQTSVNMETSSGATGMPGQNEFLGVAPYREPVLTAASLHPACFRSGRWTFDLGATDELGDRPFADKQSNFWNAEKLLVSRGTEGQALRLDGKTRVNLRLRVWPLGPCTIDFLLRPDAAPEKRAAILTRYGWSSGFNFYQLPDGRLEVVRDGGDRTPKERFVSTAAMPVGEWTRVTLTFDEKVARVYFNGKQVGEKMITLVREYGNCTAGFGAEDNGFAGQIDDLILLSRPVAPDDPALSR